MKTFVALWPDSTISVVSASNDSDLALKLDYEGAYDDATIYKLKAGFYLATEIKDGKIQVGIIPMGDDTIIPIAEVLKPYKIELNYE